jgi:hypothetical protein
MYLCDHEDKEEKILRLKERVNDSKQGMLESLEEFCFE